MKKNQKASLLSLVTVLFVFSIFAVEANAQCVQCEATPEGWMCIGATSGGGGCITKQGNCTLVGICFYNGGGRAEGASKCSPKMLNHSLVNVPDSMIQDIARLNPQAASALISIRDIEMEFSVGKVLVSPIELTAEDVEKHLTLPASADYFEARKAKVREAFANKREPIVYEFFLDRDDDANTFTLRIKAVSPTASASSLEINLSKVSVGRGEDTSIRFDATSWQAN